MRKQPQLLRNINFYIFQTGLRSKHPTLESSWKLIVIFFTDLPSTLLVIRGEIIEGGRTRVDTTEDAFLVHIFQREREGRKVYINAKEIVAKLNQIILRKELYYILRKQKDEFTFGVRWQKVYLPVKIYFSQKSTSERNESDHLQRFI